MDIYFCEVICIENVISGFSVLKIFVKEGSVVKENEPIMVLEALKMETKYRNTSIHRLPRGLSDEGVVPYLFN